MAELSLPIRRLGVLVKILVRARTDDGSGVPVGPIQAYLDTGASDTMLDHHVLASLDLEPIRSTSLSVLGREESSFHDLYAVEVAVVVADQPPRWVEVEALAGAVYQTGGLAALGRDFLASVELSYDGPRRRAVLRW